MIVTCAVAPAVTLFTCTSPITPPVELTLEKRPNITGGVTSSTKLDVDDHAPKTPKMPFVCATR
ncbi:MAG: hypothetical protein NTX64_01745, partial [Elusimicrobia bacterium]|nr:hypothetical protein [Elusimicrobiota bacterium]